VIFLAISVTAEAKVLQLCNTDRPIAVRWPKSPHRYWNSRAVWHHTVLPASRQRWHSSLYLSRSWYSI